MQTDGSARACMRGKKPWTARKKLEAFVAAGVQKARQEAQKMFP